jgi:hypothetical protein
MVTGLGTDKYCSALYLQIMQCYAPGIISTGYHFYKYCGAMHLFSEDFIILPSTADRRPLTADRRPPTADRHNLIIFLFIRIFVDY